MNCRQASVLLARRLSGALDREAASELGEHLQLCSRCARREGVYRRIHDEVCRMEPAQPPGELGELVALGVKEALTGGAPPKGPPADPSPELPGHKKALIVIGVLLFLVALTVGLIAKFRGEYAPVPGVASVALLSGTVDIRTPGSSDWRQAGPHEFLPRGAELRTGPDSALKLRSAGVEWWLPAMSAIGLDEPPAAELLVGRVYARCDGGAGKPARLVSTSGTVTCGGGEFSAVMSLKRLRVGCISGGVQVGEEGQETKVNAIGLVPR
jgi:hypothetical protein